jgi:hypothetical protein
MLKSQDNEVVFKWEVTVADEVLEMSDSAFNQLMEAGKKGIKMVKVGNKVVNPAFFKSAKKIFKNPINNFIDWTAIEQKDYKHYKDIPEEKKVVSDAKSNENREEIKSQIREMLKKRNKDWKPIFKDEIHKSATDDVWEHLKSSITALKFPTIDETWKDGKDVMTQHTEGKETHPVAYKTKIVDLGDKYDHHFWAEANYIFCSVCNKHLRKQIVIFNDYESECVVRNL